VPGTPWTRHRRRRERDPEGSLSMGQLCRSTAIGLATDWASGCRSGRQGTAQSGLIGSKQVLVAGPILRPTGGETCATAHQDRWFPVSSLRTAINPQSHARRPTWPPAEMRCRISPFGQRSCEAPNGPLLLWLAVSKMLHRSLGRQGYGQPQSALAVLTDRERSRQRFPSALRAPLTRRVFPGATSFQHQPTREESP
jgi:hypothetical protein